MYFYFRQNNIHQTVDRNTSDIIVIDSLLGEDLFEKGTEKDRLCNITLAPSRIDQDVADSCNDDSHLLSYEELLDLLDSYADTAGPMNNQVNDVTAMVSDNAVNKE